MKKQKKQNLLTMVIILLVIALIMMIGSIIYEEKINMAKQPVQNPEVLLPKEDNKDEDEKENNKLETPKEEQEPNGNTIVQPEVPEKEPEYIGEEEKNSMENTTQSDDEKAIDLVKKEYGTDKDVSFNIEKKNGSKYRIAVRDKSTTVLAWYEVDTETWEVSEY